MQCSFIKFSPLLYGSGFLLKRKHYYAFIVQKNKKHTIFKLNFIKKL